MAVFDASSSGAVTNAGSPSSLTFSHTCTGSNGFLEVSIGNSTNRNVSSVTYNGVTLTQQSMSPITQGSVTMHQYYIVAPATGTHNIVVSLSGAISSGRLVAQALSFTAVNQSTPIVTQDADSSDSTPITNTVTTTFDSQTIVGAAIGASGGLVIPLSGQTVKSSESNLAMKDAYLPTTTAGVNNFSWTVSGGTSIAICLVLMNIDTSVIVSDTVSSSDIFFGNLTSICTSTVHLADAIVTSILVHVWRNITKNVSNWINLDKS